MTVMDPEFERHRRTWIGFTRFIKFGALTVVIILVGLAWGLL
ncbi:MAG TPA: aa3-type cytochrome c oxidase subunit IV [Stellaceae bacterium]|nr:aa3-type cytochrome c oxidase subunit IV [Stellaceae bacterium]